MALIVKPKFATLQQLPTLKNNLLNAYCKFTYDKQHLTSKVKFNSSKNPDWDAVLTFKNIKPQGIIWIEVFHQQPPYDVIIGAASVSIKSLKLKPAIARPVVIDLLSTKEVKIGTITVMFEYIPSDVELEMGIDNLSQTIVEISESETFSLNTGQKIAPTIKNQPNKYTTQVNFTDSVIFYKPNLTSQNKPSPNKNNMSINKNNRNSEVKPSQGQFIIPPLNKNQEGISIQNVSFGPNILNQTQSKISQSAVSSSQAQAFSPQTSYQVNFQKYGMTGPPSLLDEVPQKRNTSANQSYQPQISPPLNIHRRQNNYLPNQNFNQEYAYKNAIPTTNQKANYNVKYPPNMNVNVNVNPNPFTYPNNGANNNNYGYYYPPNTLPSNHNSKRGSLEKQPPQPKQKISQNKTLSFMETPKMSQKQYEKYMYKKMQLIIKQKEVDQLRQKMMKQFQRK